MNGVKKMAKKKISETDIVLKPCPFCGVELVMKEEIWRNPNTALTHKQKVYSHPHTNCVLDYKRLHFYAEPWKVEAWNRRYTPTSEIDFDYEAED